MIYTYAIYADAAHTQVTGTDTNGQTETRPLSEPHEFRRADEFITGFLKDGGVIAPYVVPEPQPHPKILGPISAATLSINAGEVTGIETAVNFGGAFMVDIDTYWVFFTTPEPDTNYLVLGNVPFVRYADYIEIVAADLTEVSLTTWRVN